MKDNFNGILFDALKRFNRKTNADKIRAMSDEELAALLANTNGDFPPNTPREGLPINLCERWWLDWLKQEVQDG